MATKLKDLKVKKVDFVDAGANPDADIKLFKRNLDASKTENIFKRLADFFLKEAGKESKADDVQKSAVTFTEQMNERKTMKIADEMWDICFALQNSLCSIMRDDELDSQSTQTAMEESLAAFNTTVESAITQWSEGKSANIIKSTTAADADELEFMKSFHNRLDLEIQKMMNTANTSKSDHEKQNPQEGEKKIMNIDKSKLTESERVFLESIEKRYGVEDGIIEKEVPPIAPTVATPTPVVTDPSAAVTKALADLGLTKNEGGTNAANDEDIYKGLNPLVKAEIEALKKFRQDTEDKELHAVAKKYAIIGKKEEELFPVLKNLKAAGGTAYQDMITILDETVSAIEKSGVFSEIGKSGHGTVTPVDKGASEVKIEGIAKSYVEKDPTLSYEDAIAKAWENNPDLMLAYEQENGF